MSSKKAARAAALGVLAMVAGCNEIAGIREGDPIGSPIACDRDSDCPGPAEPECSTFAGCKGGQCSYAQELDGTAVASQVAGDCTQRVCDGNGGIRLQAFDADVEDDGKPCTLDACENGLPKHTPQQELPCYEGPDGTKDVGICKAGTQLCDESFQPLGGCEGQVLPELESCLTPADENCNGETNEGGEGCVCTPAAVSTCYTGLEGTAGVGACKVGTCLCNDSGTGCDSPCDGEVIPAAAESCATTSDDDCNGKTDAEDGCVCVSNQTDACYTGPPGTEGVGTCQGGTQTCDATGSAYLGPCSGEVVPKPWDDCTSGGDEDCDGASIACTGTTAWVKASATVGSSSSANIAESIASDAAGNLYAAGTTSRFDTSIDLGGGPLTPPNHGSASAAYVVKLAPDGTHIWSKLLPCASTPRLSVAAGQVALAYTVAGHDCDFGDGMQYTDGIALVRLDAATGAFVSKAVIGNGNTQLSAMAAASDAIYLAGYQVGSGTNGLDDQPFVVKVGANDAVAWEKGFATAANPDNRVRALALLPDGAVAFAGNAYLATIDIGGAIGDGASYTNHYYGVLEPGGSVRWGTVFSATWYLVDYPRALAATPDGHVVALGGTYGNLQVGGVTVPGYDAYLAALAPADGAVTWAKVLNREGGNLESLSVDAVGHISIGSYLGAGSDLGGGPVQSGHYITKLDGAGAHLWTKGVPLDTYVTRIVAATDAGLMFTGRISGVQSFDGTTVGQQNQYEVVFGKLAP